MSVSIILQSITAKRDGKGGSFYVYYYHFPKRKWPKVQCEKLLKKVELFFVSNISTSLIRNFFYIIILQKNVIFFSVWRYPNGFLYYWNDFEISKLTKILNYKGYFFFSYKTCIILKWSSAPPVWFFSWEHFNAGDHQSQNIIAIQ